MHPKRKQKLMVILLGLMGIGAIIGLILYFLSQSIDLFLSPSDIAKGNAPIEKRIRAGGMVREGSVVRNQSDLKVRFIMTDYVHDITVAYEGILPDLFREGQGIVAQGSLQANGIFLADEVLAKHDENYMPPEVADAINKAHSESTNGEFSTNATNADVMTQGTY